MKHKIFFILFIFSTLAFSQKEANIWYFGDHAGLDFNSGAPVALTDSQMQTNEGCAVMSNASGQMLFYSNGVTIWNRNHQVMLNGSGLLGDESSTQSCVIVPKPGSSTLYYIFTTDAEGRANGFRYSIVDMELDGGLGGVTNDKNVSIYSPTTEKLTVIKHSNNIDYWIITHGVNNNKFYCHLLKNIGLDPAPAITNIGIVTPRPLVGTGSDTPGVIKVSPNGTKLVACHYNQVVELFDFNSTTGLISNQQIVSSSGINTFFYGAEFSVDSKRLYIVRSGVIIQYNLGASPVSSSSFIVNYNDSTSSPISLQLGPDNKIYVSLLGRNKIGVINRPEILGAACDYKSLSIDLGGKICRSGLPSFVQSFFVEPVISLTNTCFGDITQFEMKANNTPVSSIAWNFGDGSTSTDLNPTHTYTNSGTYSVSVSVNGGMTKTRDITISPIPTATQPQDIMVCDTNNDGLYNFDLTAQNTTILNGQDPNVYTIQYFASATDYANRVAIVSPSSYINKVPYQQETIIAEVSNKINGECKSTTTFNIDVFDSPKPNATNAKIIGCDDMIGGTDSDGRILFNLTNRTVGILNGQSPTQFLITYYKDAGLTQPILTPAAYQNTNRVETIYGKVFNKDNPNCFVTISFPIEVYALPVINSVVDLKQCDDDIDGFSVFNLGEAKTKITANASVETITFFKTAVDANNNTNPILNPTSYTNQVVSVDKVFARVANANNCFRIAQVNLIVSTTQIPLAFKRNFTQCDDAISGTNTDGVASFDFSGVTNQILSIFPVGQQLDVTYYKNVADALAERNAITDISNYRNIGSPNTQNIYIRVDSRLNNDCLGLGNHITLTVEPIPIVQPMKLNHCDDNQDGLFAFDTSAIQTKLLNGLTNVTVSYFDQNNNPLPSPLPNPFVTSSQILKVFVKNNTPTACSFETTLQFIVDDLPEAFPIAPSLTAVCDDEMDPVLQDGKFAFDTSGFQATILGGQTGMTVNYFDANNNRLSSPLPNPFITATQNVKVEVVNPTNPSCAATTVIPFVVNPVPKIQLTGDELVCSDLPTFTKIINAGLVDESQKGNFTYSWTLDGNPLTNETNYDLTVNKKGIYKVEAASSQGCSRTRTITVNASDKATVKVDIVDLSSENSISVLAAGAGDYVFSLDDENGDYQNNNVFTNVPAGIHTVFVKDLNGCGIVPQEVALLGIPNYFTPNHDGYNDTWNIKGVNSAFNTKTIVRIFDRYGKLLKEINPMGDGWDGTYIGQPMPATDYWYSIQLPDGRIFRGHFALKR